MVMPIRKRLLGFAFASADLLVELTPQGVVAMALGSGPSATTGPETFQNRPFTDRLTRASAAALSSRLEGLKPGARLGPLEITLDCGEGRERRAAFSAFLLPELAPNASCSIRYEGPAFAVAPAEPILTPDALLARARDVLQTAARGSVAVSFIDIVGLAAAPETAARATARIESVMQSASVGGASAARLTAERYALLCDRSNERDVEEEVRQTAKAEGLDVQVIGSSTTVTQPPVNALRAMRFAVEACLQGGGLARPDVTFETALARTIKEAEGFQTMVRNRDFALHYQPIVDLKTGAVHHFEALARFSNDGGPAGIVRMAEELDLIEAFDLAVAERALMQLRKRGSGLLKIAINVSGASLANDAYVDSLLRMTASNPDERRRLIIEVTESAAVADLAAANRRLGALREAGIKLCIDDFGAGAASLDYIHGLAVDTVKIDGKFVQNLERDAKARTLITHLVELCASLKLTTIAEFVETQGAADILKGLGVDYGQGWLFGKAEAEPRTILQTAVPARRRGTVEAWG